MKIIQQKKVCKLLKKFEKAEPKSEIKEHLKKCLVCRKSNPDNFKIIKECKSDFEAKITGTL